MSDKKRVAVIFGGQSSEHEVSRVSAQSVISNIDTCKYDIIMIGITKEGNWLLYEGPIEKIGTGEWEAAAMEHAGNKLNNIPKDAQFSVWAKHISCALENKDIDVVFPVLHGCNGEDGTIQGLFELAGIPYVGCGVLGAALGMDKAYAKIIFEKEGIPQGKYLVADRKQIAGDVDTVTKMVEDMLTYPCFVKPSNAGSSVGVSKAHDRNELINSLNLAARYDRRVLVEEFINGREIECAVLGNDDAKASTVGEIIACNEFYDYTAKYNSGDSSKIEIPAKLPADTIESIRQYAVRAFKCLDCSGLSRVDFFVHNDTGKVYINEINTLPGFTSISMYPKLWEASGIPYNVLIEKLIDLAIDRFEDNKRDIGKE